MKPDLLDIYSDYLISQNHDAIATGLTAMFDGEISHDQVSRHLRSGVSLGQRNYGATSRQMYDVMSNHQQE
ncbi:MAG: hypothetical protein LEGION0403_FIIPPAGN_02122 [Legionella sp.]